VDEARRALPLVKSIVRDIVESYGQIRALLEEKEARPEKSQEIEDRLEPLKDDLLDHKDELEKLGVELKSMEEGLVDFYHERDGKLVYLCWKLGEETIEFWHDLDSGYAGRQPL
jgi:hypothetical protein